LTLFRKTDTAYLKIRTRLVPAWALKPTVKKAPKKKKGKKGKKKK